MDARDLLDRMLLDASAEPTALPLSLLRSITNDFSDDRQIGSGGFAVVYKGVLKNGTVAVKSICQAVDMDQKSFDREVTSLVRLKHNNIVRFLGYCGDTQVKVVENCNGKLVMADIRQRLLCFEFLPKRGLNEHISDGSKGLDWRTRYQIIKGICKGLCYLHQQNIVHLDLKPANILLDNNMVPKIADFGLSKCFDETQTGAIITSNMFGSLGYSAPEFYGGVIKIQSDIYSLGIIITEILTGKKGHSEIENVLESWRTRFNTSKGDAWLEQVRLCAEIGIECTDFNPVKRPTAMQIIERLDEIDCRYGYIETDLCPSSATHADALIDCVSKNLGYCNGKPIAAFTIYKCLLHWKSFEAEKTSVFGRLLQLIGNAVENYKDDIDNLAYWLSNTSSLLFLLQRTFKSAGGPDSVSRKEPPQPISLFGRIMALGFRSSTSFADIHVEATRVVHQVEAQYPALIFKQQVTCYLEKIYGTIRENIIQELSTSLSLCIQAPRTMKANRQRVSGRLSRQSQSINHWDKIIESLDNLLWILKANFKLLTQIFSYINTQLFNSVLLHRECCSFSNGEYVKAGLAELELWCAEATSEYAAASWDELKHIRQAVGFCTRELEYSFLVSLNFMAIIVLTIKLACADGFLMLISQCIFQKCKISYDEIINDLCPILSVPQLYKICTQYWDDKYDTLSVSSDVLRNMRRVMTATREDSKAESSSFLLDDDHSSIPFSVEDITNSIEENDLLDVKPAEELVKKPAFQFLKD